MPKRFRDGYLLVLFALITAVPIRADETSTPPATNAPDVESREAESAVSKPDQEYYELLQLFVDTLDQVERNYVKDLSRRELMEAAIEGMISKLDQHSEYIEPDELDRFKSGVESQFGGIGIQVSRQRRRLRVISPIVGSPAYRAGVLAGDVITHINGESAEGLSLDDAVKRMKGPIGTKVKITVRHPDGESEELELPREIVRVETVLGHHRNDDDSWNYWADEDHKIAYIRVTAFARHTVADLRKVLKQLAADGLNGLVLDLRFNPGGLLSAAIQVCDLFVEDGRIVSTSGRNVEERHWDAHRRGTYTGFPIAVLVNQYSASASEIVAACLQDHQRAVVIGQRTYGKGSVQNIIELEHGRSALKLTTAGYQRPSGKNIHRFPDADEDDEWGVLPNDGFVVKLSDTELRQLIRHQQATDIARRGQPAESLAEAGEEGDPEQEPPADEVEFVDAALAKAIDYLLEAGESKVAAQSSEVNP